MPISELYMYVVSAWGPCEIECKVPFEVDEETIFFGPCNRPLRKKLRRRYLNNGEDEILPDRNIYIIGVSTSEKGSNHQILWAGKINKVMTFEYAYNNINDKIFQKMRSLKMSPLHLKPVFNDNELFQGYELISDYHNFKVNSKWHWVTDIVEPSKYNEINRLFISNSKDRLQLFEKDCCFLCSNIFFSHEMRLDFNDEMINFVKLQYHETQGIAANALRGFKNGNRTRFRGNIILYGDLAESFIQQIKVGSEELNKTSIKSVKTSIHSIKPNNNHEETSRKSRC